MATTLYVFSSEDAKTAALENDSAKYTDANTFASISAAVNEAIKSTENITIEIAEGDYTENISYGKKKYIVDEKEYVGGISFKAADGAKVNITGQFWVNSGANNIKDISFDGLNIECVAITNGYYTPIGINANAVVTATGISVTNCTLTSVATGDGVGTEGVQFGWGVNVDGAVISDNTITADCGIYTEGAGNSNIQISGNTIFGRDEKVNKSDYNGWAGIYITNVGTGVEITENTVSDTSYVFVRTTGNGAVIKDNTFANCSDERQVRISSGSMVSGNTIDGVAQTFETYSGNEIFVRAGLAGEDGDTVVINGKAYTKGSNVFADLNAANRKAVTANATVVIAEDTEYTTGVFDNIADHTNDYWGPASPAENVTTVQIDGSVAASIAAVINNKKATVSSTGSLKGVEHVTVTGENGELLVAGEVTTNNLRTALGASITVSGKAFLNGVTVGDTYWGTSAKKSVITFDGAEVEYSGQGGGDINPLQFDVKSGNALNIINESTVESSADRYELTVNVEENADFNVGSGSSVTAENINNSGNVKVDGATLSVAGTVTNNGAFNVSGKSTINVGTLEGTYIAITNGTLVGESNIGGNIRTYEKFAIEGTITVKQTNFYGESTIKEGAVWNGGTTIVSGGSEFTLEKGGEINSRFFNVMGTAEINGEINLKHSDPRQKLLQVHEGGIANINKDGVVTVDGHNAVVNAGGTLNVYGELNITKWDQYLNDAARGGILINNGSVFIDAAGGQLSATTVSGEGTFTINAADFTGAKKIIDLNQDTSLAGKVIINGEGVTAIYGADGDVTITDADMSTIYVDAAYTEDNVGDGMIFGINAFADINAALKTAPAGATIAVNGEVKGQWLNQEWEGLAKFNGALNFQKADGAAKAVIKATDSPNWYSYLFTDDVTIGKDVTLQIADNNNFVKQWDNFVDFAPAGDEVTFTVDGTFIYSCGNFGAGGKVDGTYTPDMTKTVNVVVNKDGKMLSIGESNNTFFANSTLTVTGYDKHELQFSTGSYTQFGGVVNFKDTSVRIWGSPSWHLSEDGQAALGMGKATFTGEGLFTAVNTRIDVIDGIPAGSAQDTATGNPGLPGKEAEAWNWHVLSFDKESVLTNTDIYAGDMYVLGKTITMNGGSLNLTANRYQDQNPIFDYENRVTTGTLDIAEGAAVSITDGVFSGNVNNAGSLVFSGASTINIGDLNSESSALVLDSADVTASSIKGKKAYINIKGDNTYDGTMDAYWIKVGYTDGETVNTGSLSFNKDASVKSAVLQIGEGSSLTYGSESESTANAFGVSELYAGEGSKLTIQNVDATSNIPVLFAQGDVVIDNADIKGHDLVLGNDQGDASLAIKDSTVSFGGSSNAVVIIGDAVGGTLTLDNSYVTINRVGPGSSWKDTAQDVLTIGYKEAAATVSIENGSTLEIKYGTAINANSVIDITDGTFIAAKEVTNNGTIKVTGEAALDIASLTGNRIRVEDGAVLKDSVIGIGSVGGYGKATIKDSTLDGFIAMSGTTTFEGNVQANNLGTYYGDSNMVVAEDAVLTVGKAASSREDWLAGKGNGGVIGDIWMRPANEGTEVSTLTVEEGGKLNYYGQISNRGSIIVKGEMNIEALEGAGSLALAGVASAAGTFILDGGKFTDTASKWTSANDLKPYNKITVGENTEGGIGVMEIKNGASFVTTESTLTVDTNGKLIIDGAEFSMAEVTNNVGIGILWENVKPEAVFVNKGSVTVSDSTFTVGSLVSSGTITVSADTTLVVSGDFALTGSITVTDTKFIGVNEAVKIIDVTDGAFISDEELALIKAEGKGFVVERDKDGDIVVRNQRHLVTSESELVAALQKGDVVYIDSKIKIGELADCEIIEQYWANIFFAETGMLLWPKSEIGVEINATHVILAPENTAKVTEEGTLEFTDENTGSMENITTDGDLEITNNTANGELRSDVTGSGSDNTIVINNNSDELKVTGKIETEGSVEITNDNGKTGKEAEAVINGGNDNHGVTVKAEEIVLNNEGHAVVDFTATGKVTIKNNSTDTVVGNVEGSIVEIVADPGKNGAVESSTIKAEKYIQLSGQTLADTTLDGNVWITGDTTFEKLDDETVTNTIILNSQAVKVNNGATMTVAAGSVLDITGERYLFAGDDNGYSFETETSAAGGTILINGTVKVTQVNANGGGIITVGKGGELLGQSEHGLEAICVEKGEIADAAAGTFTVEEGGKAYTQRFNIFAGGSATIKGYLSSEQAFTSGSLNAVVSLSDKGTLTIDGGELSAGQIEHTDERHSGISIAEGSSLTIKNGGVLNVGGTVTNNGSIFVSGDSQLMAGALGFGANGKVQIDAKEFTGFNKVVDLADTDTLEGNEKFAIINKAEDLQVIYKESDIYLTDADMSTIYVDATLSGDFGDDLGDGKYLGVNAFDSIADVIKATQKAAEINIQLGGKDDDEMPEATNRIVMTQDPDYMGTGYNVVGNLDGKTVTISGTNNTNEYLWFDLNCDETVAQPAATKLVLNGAALKVEKVKAYNNAVVEITDSLLDFNNVSQNCNLYTNGNGKITVTNSEIRNVMQISAYGKDGGEMQFINSVVSAGSGNNVKGVMSLSEGSSFVFSGLCISAGGVLSVDNSTMVRKAVITPLDEANTTAINGGGFKVVVGKDTTNTGSLKLENGAVLDISKAYASDNYTYESDDDTGLTTDGTVTVAAGSIITVDGSKAAVTFNADKVVNAGTVTVNGDVTMKIGSFEGNLYFGSAVLSDDSSIAVTGNVTAASLTFSAGDLTVADGGTLTVTGDLGIRDVDFSSTGTITVYDGSLTHTGSLFINGSAVVDGKILVGDKEYTVTSGTTGITAELQSGAETEEYKNIDGTLTVVQSEDGYSFTTAFARTENTGKGDISYVISQITSGDKVLEEGVDYELSADGTGFTLTGDDPANIRVTVTVTDSYGEASAQSFNKAVTVNDETAPVLGEITASETAATKENVTVSIAATDNFGEATVEYSIDGGTTWTTGTSVEVSVNNTTVQFRATDAAGNVSAISEYTVTNIDKVAPTLNIAASETTATNKDVILTANVSDGTVEYFNGTQWVACDKFTVGQNGTYQFRVTDAVGNVTTGEYTVTNIDKDAPVLGAITITPEAATNDNVTVSIAGPADATVEYSIDGGTTWITGTSVEVSVNDTTVQFRATDAVGNVSAISEYTVTNIDKIAPELGEITASTAAATNGSVTVSIAGPTDNFGGSVTIEYSKDGGETWDVYVSSGVTFETNGTVQFRATDAAGNVSAISEYTVSNIDKVAPEFTNARFELAGDKVVASWSVADSGSDIAKVLLFVDGKQVADVTDKTAYEFEAGVFGEFKLTAFDVAGNVVSSSKLITLGGSGSGDTEAEPAPVKKINITAKTPDEEIDALAESYVIMAAGKSDIKIQSGSAKEPSKVTVQGFGKEAGEKTANDINNITVGNYTSLDVHDNIANLGNVKVGNNASLQVLISNQGETLAGIDKKQTIKAGKNSEFVVHGDLDLGKGNDQIKIGQNSVLAADNIVLGEGNNKIDIGKNAVAKTGNINLGEGKNQIKIGNDATFLAGNINYGTGNAKLTIGKDADVTTGNIKLGEGKNQINIGNEADVKAGNITATGSANDRLTVGKDADVVFAEIDLGAGNDTFNIGADSDVTTGNINLGEGKNQIKIGNEADVKAGKITAGSANDKLTVGKDADVLFAEINLGAGNNTFNIGADSDVTTGNILTGAGNDKLVIGKDAYLHTKGLIDMGDGKNTLDIKKNGQLFVDSLAGIKTIKAAKGAELHITSQIDLENINGSWKNLEIFHELDDITGFENGVLYGNETDLISFDGKQTASFSLEGDDLAGLNVEFSNDGVIWQDLAFGTEVTFTHLRVSAEGLKADETKEYSLTKATLA